MAIEVPDVPSTRIRNQVIDELKKWFPDIDPVTAENSLRGGPSTLIAGIDEQSGNRLLEVLKSLKVDGRLIRDVGGRSFFQRLWNPGLLIAGGLVIVAALAQGLIGFILFLLGAASPFTWAFWRRRRQAPLLGGIPVNSDAVRWMSLSDQYSEIISKLETQDAELLRSAIAMIVDLQRSLKSHSLASVAAGEERGDLYKTLTNSSVTAIDLCRRVNSSRGEERDSLRRELHDLINVVGAAHDQFRMFDREEIKPVEELRQDLDRTVESIDRIIQDVRSPLGLTKLMPDELRRQDARHSSPKESE